MKRILNFIYQNKYEALLFGLVQHTFIALFLSDLEFYTKYIWPVNMVILALTCGGVFLEKGKLKNITLKILILVICLFPIVFMITGNNKPYMEALSISYVIFFVYVFYEVIKFLLKPSYINTDIISASFCGFLLLIEISTFIMQSIFYANPLAYKGLDVSNPAATYMDFVYFSTITITSIGYGNILPNIHQTKLLAALFGIIGQFYSVVLVGILISKFTSNNASQNSSNNDN